MIDDLIYEALEIRGVHNQVKHFNSELLKHFQSEVISGLTSLLMYHKKAEILELIDSHIQGQKNLCDELASKLLDVEREYEDVTLELPLVAAGSPSISKAVGTVQELSRREEKLANKKFLASSRLNSQRSKYDNLLEFRRQIEAIQKPVTNIGHMLDL